jgi:hypothetical protein
MKFHLLLFFCLFSTFVLHANDTIQYSNKPISFGIGQTKVSYLTPIVYQSYKISFGYHTILLLPNRERVFNYDFNCGVSTNINNNIIFSFGDDLYFGQNHLVTTSKSNNFKFLMGYAYWYDDDFYMKPDNINNILYTSIANKLATSIVFTWKYKKIYIRNNFALPLFGLYYGSKYSQGLPGIIEKESTVWDACKFGSLGMNTQFSNNLICDVKVKNKKTKFQTFRFEYSIEYVMLELHNNIKNTVFHEFKISTLINQVNYNHE